MDQTLGAHFRAVVKPEFPPNAEINPEEYADVLTIFVQWKLGTDPAHPNKRSRGIRIVFPSDTVDDYQKEKSPARRAAADENLKAFVREHLRHFNPDHDTPYGQGYPTPVEKWEVPPECLNC